MTSKLQDWKDEKISQLEDQIEHMSVAIENSGSMAFAYKQEQEIERLRGLLLSVREALVGIEPTDLDLDWNRLRSGDNRALLADHQDVFDVVAGMRNEIERLRAFARRIMQAWPDGDVDGLDLQEAAVEAGILRETRPREACGESCRCADYYGDRNFRDGHVVCYRVVKEALGDSDDSEGRGQIAAPHPVAEDLAAKLG